MELRALADLLRTQLSIRLPVGAWTLRSSQIGVLRGHIERAALVLATPPDSVDEAITQLERANRLLVQWLTLRDYYGGAPQATVLWEETLGTVAELHARLVDVKRRRAAEGDME